MSHQKAGEETTARARTLVLAALLAGVFMILVNNTIVNVAAPSIQRDLDAANNEIEWVISGYALAYGLLLIPGGRLGDRYGYKRMFLIAVTGFSLASLLSGTATGPAQLILWQVVMGVMAGLMNPQTLAIIQAAFPPAERGRAYGLYGAVSGVAVAVGPLLGGALVEWDVAGLAWRPVFLVNVPIGVLTLVLAARWLRPARGSDAAIDYAGGLLMAGSLVLILVPLIESSSVGWPAWSIACLVAAPFVLSLFVLWALRRLRADREPLFDVRLFKNVEFSTGIGIGLLYFAGFISLWFLTSIYLQTGVGLSALDTGLVLLPPAVGTVACGMLSDRLFRRLGKWLLLLGTGLAVIGAVGTLLTLRARGADLDGPELAVPLFVVGMGTGLVVAPNVDIVMSSVHWKHAGASGGLLNTAQRVGTALGIAVIGLVFFGHLGDNASRAAREAVPRLEQDLVAAGMSRTAAEDSARTFVRCFAETAKADDPSHTPAGCPKGNDDRAIGRAFDRAADTALRENFNGAAQEAAYYSAGAVALALLLVFALPARQPTGTDDWEGGAGDWSGGDGGGGDWDASHAQGAEPGSDSGKGW
ncbi:MFS transporter [Streptomyces sp. NRRL B-1347]|uniref:MFS transporter n=1 Tax=Streptomyces sp. NRRL B-1347 TaxID=1476877 RepID=UPI000689B866|nr:MFS transporter [Streptomyces sp. NRRL B-1347]